MSWFKRADPTQLDGLAEALGGPADVLALGVGPDVVLAGTRAELALKRGGAWRVWGWEEISGGSWKAETSRFRWRMVDGDQHEVELTDANRLPELFRERVEASTVVQGYVDVAGGQVQIIGRRSLSAELTVHWYAVPGRGVDMSDPAIREAVVEETDRLKAEYF